MKKNKIIIALIIAIVLVCILNMIMILYKDINPKEGDSSNRNSDSTHYKCEKDNLTYENVNLSDEYEFDYFKKEEGIVNGLRRITVTFSSEEIYNKSDLSKNFPENNIPDEIINDKDKLTQTFIWYNVFLSEENDVGTYLNIVESYGYVCENK